MRPTAGPGCHKQTFATRAESASNLTFTKGGRSECVVTSGDVPKLSFLGNNKQASRFGVTLSSQDDLGELGTPAAR